MVLIHLMFALLSSDVKMGRRNGVSLIAHPGEDTKLLVFVRALEQATGYRADPEIVRQ